MVKLGQDHVRDWRIPCPPITEQRAIARYLDREATRFWRMVGIVDAAIERLQEYRTALITAAVTGKIDVRETARAESNGLQNQQKSGRQTIPNTV